MEVKWAYLRGFLQISEMNRVSSKVSVHFHHIWFISVSYTHLDVYKRQQPPLSTSMLAILTALNLGDEVIKQRDKIQSLQKELSEAKEMIKIFEGDKTNIYDMTKKIRS